MSKPNKTFNDRMVSKTVIPAIYLWLLASGSVVAMGIWKPDVVLANLDGFIALIAIIGGTAGPALSTILRMWESEQTKGVDDIPSELEHKRLRDEAEKEHKIELEKLAQKHEQEMAKSAQDHSQEMAKMTKLPDIKQLKPKKGE